MLITVTAAHIAAGEPAHCLTCPVALALIDAGALAPVAGYTRLTWNTTTSPRVQFHTPPSVIAFMRSLDRGDSVQPFSFDLDPADAHYIDPDWLTHTIATAAPWPYK